MYQLYEVTRRLRGREGHIRRLRNVGLGDTVRNEVVGLHELHSTKTAPGEICSRGPVVQGGERSSGCR